MPVAEFAMDGERYVRFDCPRCSFYVYAQRGVMGLYCPIHWRGQHLQYVLMKPAIVKERERELLYG